MTDSQRPDRKPLRLVASDRVPEPMPVGQPSQDKADDGIVDLQAAARGKLEAEIRRLRATNAALIEIAKANLAAQAQTQSAVLAIMECETLAALDRKLAGRVAGALNAECVRVFLEGHAPLRSAEAILGGSPELVRALLGDSNERLGPVDRRFHDALYGPRAARVRSEAIVRLDVAGHCGVLCIGTADAGAFNPEQASDLVHFLARVIERRLSPWLRHG